MSRHSTYRHSSAKAQRPPGLPTPLRPGSARITANAANTNQPTEVSLKTWLAVFGSALGAFMAVLNIQIVNSSLADIQGAIGAGIDDGGWISTAYLVTEIVVIPLSGWLARVFSMRLYLLVNAVLFLLFSVGCAFTHNLGQMIVMRAFQGFTGGVLIPLSFTLIMTLLPRAKQPVGLALFAVSATFAPAIGPTIGGYLNETYGWQYVFYVNLVPGAAMIAMLWFSLERAPLSLDLLKQGDWFGIIAMAVGLGALETVLEEGNKDDWLGSPFILRLSILAAASLTAFIAIELTVRRPLLDLRLLRGRNFGFGTLANFLLGVGLYGSVFILPLYLSQLQGYNAEQIGEVLAWYGLPQLVLIPFVPRLMRIIDARILVGLGFLLFAVSCFMNVGLTADFAGPQFFWPNIVRAFGQAMIMTPLSVVATAGVAREQAGTASALYNMTRNLGGAIGIAVLQTFLTKREQYHSDIIMDSVSVFDEATRARLQALTRYFLEHGVSDPAAALHKAIVAVGLAVRQQASIMAYGDSFYLIGAALLVALLASASLRKAGTRAGGGAH